MQKCIINKKMLVVDLLRILKKIFFKLLIKMYMILLHQFTLHFFFLIIVFYCFIKELLFSSKRNIAFLYYFIKIYLKYFRDLF